MVIQINTGSVSLGKVFRRKKYRPITGLDRIAIKITKLEKQLRKQPAQPRCSIHYPQQPNDVNPEVSAEGLLSADGRHYLMVPLGKAMELPRDAVISSPQALINEMHRYQAPADRQSYLIHQNLLLAKKLMRHEAKLRTVHQIQELKNA